jgi:hypothetical protein
MFPAAPNATADAARYARHMQHKPGQDDTMNGRRQDRLLRF